MKISEVEKSLCKIYLNSLNNQKINIDYVNRSDSFRDRVKNLNKQFPYDMKAMMKKHNIE